MRGYIGEATVLWLCFLALLPLAIFQFRIGRKKQGGRLLLLCLFAVVILLSSMVFTLAFDYFG